MQIETLQEEVYEGECMNVILEIPEDAARLEITVTMLNEDGTLQKAYSVLGPKDIRKARQDFLDNVEGGDEFDALYALTDLGRKYAEKLNAEREENQEEE